MQSAHELLGKLYQQLDHHVGLVQELQDEVKQLRAELAEKQTPPADDE